MVVLLAWQEALAWREDKARETHGEKSSGGGGPGRRTSGGWGAHRVADDAVGHHTVVLARGDLDAGDLTQGRPASQLCETGNRLQRVT
jgi:hypothetical protein